MAISKSALPSKPDSDVEFVDSSVHALRPIVRQAAIQEMVGYTTSTGKDVPTGMSAVLKHIGATYTVPLDFELDKVRFGQLSGLSYDERLVAAYTHGLLEDFRKDGKVGSKPDVMCKDCGTAGHWSWDCPSAFE